MIIIRLSGGLGNQMFQYALAVQLRSLGREVSFDLTTEYAADRSGRDREGNERPITLPIFGVDLPACSEADLIRLTDADPSLGARIRRTMKGRHSLEKRDEDFVFDPSILNLQEGVLSGCFQSGKYFQGAAAEVRKAFCFPKDILESGEGERAPGIPALTPEASAENLRQKAQILSAGAAGGSTAVHLRFGDYLTKSDVYGGIATDAYYAAAIRRIREVHPLTRFFVFSNDSARAAEWAGRQKDPERFTVVQGNDEVHGYCDLYLMSLCQDFVIANSSFSWWGAWLGRSPRKVICAPSLWMHEKDGSELRRQDIYTDGMVRISPRGVVIPDLAKPQGTKPPLVSVIVAAYNIAPYIGRALDSLLGQTLRNMEFIVVDDGSTDDTGKICDAYARKDSRFCVIHKKNGGLSSARNEGLRHARGTWIGYLDGDDTARPEMFEAMLRAAETAGADMALCAYEEVHQPLREHAAGVIPADRKMQSAGAGMAVMSMAAEEDHGENSVDRLVRRGVLLSREQALEIYVRSGVADVEGGINFYNSVWSKLFRRDLCEDLTFPEGRNSEDILYTTKALTRSRSVVYLPNPLYRYTADRKGSIMNQAVGERRLRDEIPFYEEQIRYLKEQCGAELADKAAFYLARRLLYYWEDFDGKPDTQPFADAIAQKLLRNKEELCRIIRREEDARRGDRWRLRLFLGSVSGYRRLAGLYAKHRGTQAI